MRLFFLDTSAIVKRYVNETGTTWIDHVCQTQRIAISELTFIEVAATLNRRVRDGMMDSVARDTLFEQFVDDVVSFLVVRLTSDLVMDAAQIALQAPITLSLRSLDATQLASARRAFAETPGTAEDVNTFVSSDRRLLAAATWAGLAVENPEDHP